MIPFSAGYMYLLGVDDHVRHHNMSILIPRLFVPHITNHIAARRGLGLLFRKVTRVQDM